MLFLNVITDVGEHVQHHKKLMTYLRVSAVFLHQFPEIWILITVVSSAGLFNYKGSDISNNY